MTTTTPPLAVRITKSLLGYGVIAGPFYLVLVAAQAFTRDGFDPTRHAASQLANGDFGWVQVLNFVLTGAMVIAAAVGVRRALGPGRMPAWGGGLIGGFGVGMLAAAVFRADPSDGFPPGTPPGMGEVSWQGLVHLLVASAGFVCLVAACFVVGTWFGRRGATGWAWYSRISGLVFLLGFLAIGSGAGSAASVLAFTAGLVVAWAWLAAISVKLYRDAGVCNPDG